MSPSEEFMKKRLLKTSTYQWKQGLPFVISFRVSPVNQRQSALPLVYSNNKIVVHFKCIFNY